MMSQLTAQDVYEAYLRAKSEGFDPFPGCVYAELFKDQKRRYERMATLLNEKLTPPKQAQLLSEKEAEENHE